MLASRDGSYLFAISCSIQKVIVLARVFNALLKRTAKQLRTDLLKRQSEWRAQVKDMDKASKKSIFRMQPLYRANFLQTTNCI